MEGCKEVSKQITDKIGGISAIMDLFSVFVQKINFVQKYARQQQQEKQEFEKNYQQSIQEHEQTMHQSSNLENEVSLAKEELIGY